MRSKFFALCLGTFLGLGSVASASTAAVAPQVRLLVTVDWEGEDLREQNLTAMQELRRDFPEVPILHFLNAAYFTKASADANDVAEQIRSTLGDHDEHGLHIHGWKSLFEAAGVKFRPGPTFWDGKDLSASSCTQECGHEVDISAYSQAELAQVMRYSIQTLTHNGFQHPHSFRTGGWMGRPNVLAALQQEGFTLDSSAVPSNFLKPLLHDTVLYQSVEEIWPHTTEHTQPYFVGSKLWEVPDNAALADYMPAKTMIKVLQDHITAVTHGGPSTLVVLGYHQETAAVYIGRIRTLLQFVRDYNAKNPAVKIVYPTLPLSF